MSVEIRPEFEPRTSGLLYEAEGKTLGGNIRKIHAFSEKRGLRPITDFLDNRDIPEDDFDEDEWRATRSDWHRPADGVQAVRGLLTAIRADPKAAEKWNKRDPDGLETLIDDLEALTRVLEKADASGVRFRLDIG